MICLRRSPPVRLTQAGSRVTAPLRFAMRRDQNSGLLKLGTTLLVGWVFSMSACQPMSGSNSNVNANANTLNTRAGADNSNANYTSADRGVPINAGEPEKYSASR